MNQVKAGMSYVFIEDPESNNIVRVHHSDVEKLIADLRKAVEEAEKNRNN